MKSAVRTAALVLVFVATAVSLAKSPATHTINPTEWRQEAARAQAGKYPTMLDMTFPEFETAVRGTDLHSKLRNLRVEDGLAGAWYEKAAEYKLSPESSPVSWHSKGLMV